MKWSFKSIFQRLKKLPLSWKAIREVGDGVFQAGWRFGLLLLLLGVIVFIWRGLQNDTYTIEAFQTPEDFTKAGLNGVVLSNKLVDELNEVETFVSSMKEGPLNEIQSNVGKPDLNVEVMGIGLTLNTVTYYLRDLLGRRNRAISGEISEMDSSLNLTLRMTGSEPFHFSQSYRENGRAEALKQVLHEAAKQIILNLDPYRMAVYYYRKKEYEKSLELIGNILRDRPEDSAWAYLAWGNLLNELERSEEAIEKFKMGAEHSPDIHHNYVNWAWTEFRLERFEQSKDLFEKVVELKPKNGSYWNGLAASYWKLEQLDKADKAYAKAVSSSPDELWLYRNWANFKFQQGDSIAVEEIIGLLKKNENIRGVDYFQILAINEMYKGNNEEALRLLKNILDLDPDNIDALQQSIPIYLREKKDFDKVKALSRQLIHFAKTQKVEYPRYFLQTYYNYLAMAEYSLEEYDSSIVHARLSIAQDTTIDYPYTTLAEAHELMGDQEAFYRYLEKALERGFQLKRYLNQEPYSRYTEDQRFKDLLDQYFPEQGEQQALNQ